MPGSEAGKEPSAAPTYWINAMDGQPFFYVNKEADPGLRTTLRQDLVPSGGLQSRVFP
jgi:hypothetical protein